LPVAAAIDEFLRGELSVQEAPDEGAWHKAWHDLGLHTLPPLESALRGGIGADRLSWAFVAGYQGAIRYVFPSVPHQGWAAYAATEDKSKPATALTTQGDGFLLNGHKSWVGQSRHLDHLLVTAGDQCVLVPAQASGVHLSHRENSKFLNAMSQGYGDFEAVEVAAGAVFDSDHMREFGRREPRFVMLAGTGYLLAHLKGADQTLEQDLISLALALAMVCESQHVVPKTLAALDRALQTAVARFANAVDCNALPDWQADHRLLSMYSARIQERAAR
jgi:acyl-CoA dehydrogenase